MQRFCFNHILGIDTNVYFNKRLEEAIKYFKSWTNIKAYWQYYDKLKELYYSDSLNIIDMSYILRNLDELCVIRLSIEQLNNTPIDSCVKLLLNIANKCDNLNERIESSDEEYVEEPNTREKSSDYLEYVKHTIPAHYHGVFD